MDEMKIELSTRLMRGFVAKLLSKAIYKKLGYKIDIQLNEIAVDNVGGDVHLHIDADGTMKNEELIKAVLIIGLDED